MTGLASEWCQWRAKIAYPIRWPRSAGQDFGELSRAVSRWPCKAGRGEGTLPKPVMWARRSDADGVTMSTEAETLYWSFDVLDNKTYHPSD